MTSWSSEAVDIYGACFVESFRRHWPSDVTLRIVLDSEIESEESWSAFEREYGSPTTRSKCPKRGAIKWARKVWALNRPLPSSEWLVWIDGDVETVSPVSHAELEQIFGDADLVYLGRPWAYASETGFVGYRLSCPPVRSMLNELKHRYISGEVFSQDNWGDGFTFDVVRDALPCSVRQKSLTEHLSVRHGLHVWPATQLGRFLVHHKGPKRKVARYGSTI